MHWVILGVAATIIGFCAMCSGNYYDNKWKEHWHDREMTIVPSNIEKANKKLEELEKKWGYKKRFLLFNSGWIILLVSLAIFTTSIVCLVYDKREVKTLINQQTYYMECVETMDKYELANLGITYQILDYNKEVARIKANVETFGEWTTYSLTDWQELDYIGTK